MIWLLRLVPFLKMYGLAIGIAAILAAVTLYVANAERNRALVKAYEKEAATTTQVIAHQDEQIRALNGRIKANNARWLEMIQAENARTAQAKAEAEQVRAERDRITAALSDSRRAWQEEVAHDESLADFIAHDVPGAVWRRLCSASGNCAP